MPDVPPVLSDAPEFTAEHWQTVRRDVLSATIGRVTNLENGFVEIALTNGVAFQRKREEIAQLLTANMSVNIEHIGNGKLVTGMFVPGCGWAFRMTNEDLADYTRKVSILVHTQQQQTRQKMINHLANALESALDVLLTTIGVESSKVLSPDQRQKLAYDLASVAMEALEAGPG